ncbi:hypothetical protein Glove_81g74 [Diversispora epigaea]|uniref:Protein kinase domain-containing protein n=1 Tax=Diversispora epigaea TaxID=1348612 RepID=A0A397JAC8_9GLOM|nr:hypothetical protein Glove_81g74 [Diversispora epigaea]
MHLINGQVKIDKFIQQIQLNANMHQKIIEWIPFDRLENVTYLVKEHISIYGITKISKNEYMIVMDYAKYGSLRKLSIYLCKPVTENDPEKIYSVIPEKIYELEIQLDKYCSAPHNNIEWKKKVETANESNKNFIQYDSNKMHPEAIYTSRLIPA